MWFAGSSVPSFRSAVAPEPFSNFLSPQRRASTMSHPLVDFAALPRRPKSLAFLGTTNRCAPDPSTRGGRSCSHPRQYTPASACKIENCCTCTAVLQCEHKDRRGYSLRKRTHDSARLIFVIIHLYHLPAYLGTRTEPR